MITKSMKASFCLIACFFPASGCIADNEMPSLSEWVDKNLHEGEIILCKREVEGDYYFVASRDGKIKSAYLIDVTGKDSTPKTYVFSWSFKDENNKYLETNVPPEDIKQGYLKLSEKIYSENVSYRNLHLKDVKKLLISVEIDRYENHSHNKKLDNFLLCEVEL